MSVEFGNNAAVYIKINGSAELSIDQFQSLDKLIVNLTILYSKMLRNMNGSTAFQSKNNYKIGLRDYVTVTYV